VSRHVVGALDIGGTHVAAALVDVEHWNVLPTSRTRRPLDPHADAPTLLARIASAAAGTGAQPATKWGVAVPGPFDYPAGIGDFSGVGKFEALSGIDVGGLLRRMGVGTSGTLTFVNDAHAFALGEWVAGAGRGRGRLIATTLGTGIGSAFLVAGLPVDRGAGVPPHGRLDLVKVHGRPLEETVSRSAMLTRYEVAKRESLDRRLTRGHGAESSTVPDIRELSDLASAGDVIALEALRLPLVALGRVLGPRAVAFRAEAIVMGGSISAAWDIVGTAVRAGMDEASPRWSDACELLRAKEIDDSPLIGAAWATTQHTPRR